jgi:outer membrane biosynthesis protein TonB
MPNMSLFDPSLLSGITQMDIEVDIDAAGHVTAARPLNTAENVNWLVTAAVVSAAKEWVFEPARIGNQKVPARHTIVFRLVGS